MSNKITVEIIPATQLKEGDILLRDGGDTVTVSEILIRGTNHVSFRDEDGGPLPFYASRDVFRVVPEQQEEPVWPDADLIRIIRGTENGNRIDGSLAYRIDGGHGFRLLDGPRVEYSLVHDFDGDAIYEWEEVVPVAKSAILASLGTLTENEPEDDDAESEDETEDEDEDDCDGTCPACIIMRLITAAAAGKGKEDEK